MIILKMLLVLFFLINLTSIFCFNSLHHKLYRTGLLSFHGYQQPQPKEGAYNLARDTEVIMPCIILVNPFLDQNVGSVARTMLNFGLTELRVVDPLCDILSNNSRALAAGAYEILENAKTFTSLKDCLSDLQRVMATTIRPRHMTQTVVSPSKAAQELISRDNSFKSGIMFGRERSGLTNDEVAMADSIVTIPSFNHFSSLNLAQAVNVLGYELYKNKIELLNNKQPDVWLHPKDGERLARREELEYLLLRLEKNLDNKEYQEDNQRKLVSYRSIRNIAQRVLLTKSEIDLLQGVLSCLIK